MVAARHVPGDTVSAGSGLKRRILAKMAFRLPVPGRYGEKRGALIIDTGTTAAEAAARGFTDYDAPAQARIDAAMRAAGLILVTHEHDDHIGGLLALAARGDGADGEEQPALGCGVGEEERALLGEGGGGGKGHRTAAC